MTSVRRVITGMAAVVAGLGLAWPAVSTAQAAGVPGWRVVLRVHYPSPSQAHHDSVFDAVVTPARNDAWVFGFGFRHVGNRHQLQR